MPLDPATIASALRLPGRAVEANWPLIMAALDEFGIRSDLVEIAAAATVGTEVPHFEPISEMGGAAYLSRYDDRADLGNTEPGDGEMFKGRGYVQLTGRANYDAAGRALGLFLLDSPELVLEPHTAARVLAWFFLAHRVADAANAQDWQLVRRRVNGGLNGWPTFSALVKALQEPV
jgi:putative chitinase